MVKVKNCCCCIPVKTGAYIIGFVHVIGAMFGIIQLDLVKVALDIFCGMTFLLMIFKDGESSRLFYFAAYMAYTGIIIAVHLVFIIWDQDEEVKTK